MQERCKSMSASVYWAYWFTLAEKMSITVQQPITCLASIEKGGI